MWTLGCPQWAEEDNGGRWWQVAAGRGERGHWLGWLIKQYQRSPPAFWPDVSSHPHMLELEAELSLSTLNSCLRSVCLIEPRRIRQGRVRWRGRDAATSDTNNPIMVGEGGRRGVRLMFLWLQHPLTSHIQSVYRFNETWEPESHIWGGLNDFNQQNHFSEILGNNSAKIQHF